MNISNFDSPCIRVCVMDPDTDCCIGCGRSRNEIAGWLLMSPAERAALNAELPARLRDMTRNRRRKGGHRARRSGVRK
ncbi:MAG TPA: DUF1289 domain-containing protein [Woeseiaceae bacterium]|nr:DUF1289 domain-containing protein [Woeseiaceae bacterium]